jgi:AraC-like DNA-binding protein
MTRDLETPPGLPELARQVGMCQSRLCRCFKEVYGMTPFDYLRNKRIEKAEQLLRRGELNVTQVALSVGYASISHFTKAFKQQTGMLPSQCLRTTQ